MSNSFYIFTRKHLRILIAVFILGIFIGTLCLNLFLSWKIDSLILENKVLEKEISEKQKQITRLEENLQKHKQDVITSLKITLITDLNQHKQQQIKEKILKLFNNYFGKEISKVDPLTIRDIFHNRKITIENKDYTLKLTFLVLKHETELYIFIDN